MKKVITYGTFDLFHKGHRRLLERAKKLGDYLIVGVTTENYDDERGKLNVHQDLMTRINNVKKSGLTDQIIIEEYEGQKINDIQKYDVDIFAIGSDWRGKFDYLKEYCNVVYLERTKGISSTELRINNTGMLNLGIIGYGRIANRFIPESKFVSGVNVVGVYGFNQQKMETFAKKHELDFFTTDFDYFLSNVDAVYIASPHLTHAGYIKKLLVNNKHILCEKPLVLSKQDAIELYKISEENNLILLEAIKTAYCPGFNRLIGVAKSGLIGNIKYIEATFTKLVSGNLRELNAEEAGGSVFELASYPLFSIVKLLGGNYDNVTFDSYWDDDLNIDLFTKININYPNALATAKVGLGVKSEGDMIISGTKGYIYVPAPWWKTEYFEVRCENFEKNKKYFYQYKGEGFRYELAEFTSMISTKSYRSYKLKPSESIKVVDIISRFKDNLFVNKIK